MALIITRLAEIQLEENIIDTTNLDEQMYDFQIVQAHNFSYFVDQAYSRGIITGIDAKGTFDGEALGTRAQAATMIVRLINQDYRKVPVL